MIRSGQSLFFLWLKWLTTRVSSMHPCEPWHLSVTACHFLESHSLWRLHYLTWKSVTAFATSAEGRGAEGMRSEWTAPPPPLLKLSTSGGLNLLSGIHTHSTYIAAAAQGASGVKRPLTRCLDQVRRTGSWDGGWHSGASSEASRRRLGEACAEAFAQKGDAQ